MPTLRNPTVAQRARRPMPVAPGTHKMTFRSEHQNTANPRASSPAEQAAMCRLADAERAVDQARLDLEALTKREQRRARAHEQLRIVHNPTAEPVARASAS